MLDAERGAGHLLAAAYDNSTAAAGLRLPASTRADARTSGLIGRFFPLYALSHVPHAAGLLIKAPAPTSAAFSACQNFQITLE